VVKGDQLPEVGLWRRRSGVAVPLNPRLSQISFAYDSKHLLIDVQLDEMDALGFFLAFQYSLKLCKICGWVFQQEIGHRTSLP